MKKLYLIGGALLGTLGVVTGLGTLMFVESLSYRAANFWLLMAFLGLGLWAAIALRWCFDKVDDIAVARFQKSVARYQKDD